MKNNIQIRGHHLACIPRFYHGGYDKDFAENMKNVCSKIRKRPNIKIKILEGRIDDLCMKCPHKYKDQCNQSQEIGKWVIAQDRKIVKYLKLKPNSVRTAKEVFNLSMNKININTIRSVCKDCIFLDNCVKVGVNNTFREDLNKN